MLCLASSAACSSWTRTAAGQPDAARLAQWAALAYDRAHRDPLIATVLEPARLGKFAGDAFALGSTTQGIRAAKAHRLLVNGQPGGHAALVGAGDVVTLLPAVPAAPPDPEPTLRFARAQAQAGLRVLMEDDELAVIFKPAGPHSKPYGGAPCVEAALPALLWPSSAEDALLRPTATHRLDARVCGCLLVAKTRRAAAHLASSFRTRRVYKRYRALAVGRVAGPREIDAPLDGRPALTRLRVRSYTPHVQMGHLTTLDLEPVTGRRHQLRRHLADLGHPLVGDDLHANGQPPLKRGAGLLLQSVEIRAPHPADDGTWVHAAVAEARKFERQRERSWQGFGYECERRRREEAEAAGACGTEG
jgi:23S rRNA pseudouridine1911/1915/1917 synthase